MSLQSKAPLKYHSDRPSMTQQHLTCDASAIVAKHLGISSGLNIPLSTNPYYKGSFIDTTKLPSFRDALNFVSRVSQDFELIPAKIRARFSNNPQQLIDFLNDEKNRDEAIKLGLVTAPAPEKPDPTVLLTEIRDRLPPLGDPDGSTSSKQKKSGKMPD